MGRDDERALDVEGGHAAREAIIRPVPNRASGSGTYVFIGGVEVSLACLESLVEEDLPPALSIGYGDALSAASGHADAGELAARHGFPHVRTDDVNENSLVGRVEALGPSLIYVIGWSQLVRKRLLAAAPSCVGIHPTRLPEGRGRAPIPWTILKGLSRTASTMFHLTEGVDEGDVVGVVDIEVGPREDAGTLYAKHREAHERLVREHTAALLEGRAPRTPQDHEHATYWPRRQPDDGRIDWTRPADDVDRLVRAVTRPFPGAFTETPEGRVTIWRAEPAGDVDAPPGTWLDSDVVACGRGSLRVLEAGR
jgi:methionyl-tRNA formyltransferase